MGWPNPFRQKAFMIVNQALGGTAGGDPSHTSFPVTYEVDYIRVYQSQGDPRSDCAKTCAGANADGCCEYAVVDGSCKFLKGHHVQGGTGFPSQNAANCYADGHCDGWNDSERCNPDGNVQLVI